MITTEITKTPFDNNFVEHMKSKYFYNLPQGYTDKVLIAIVKAIGTFLHDNPNKNEGTHGVYYTDPTDTNKKMFAGILEFDKNEDNPENPGAYEYTLSYDQGVIDKADKYATDPVYAELLNQTLIVGYGIHIADANARFIICSSALAYLKEFVENQVNANPTEILEFDFSGMLTVSGGVEDNEIAVAVIPGPDLKSKVVKDDASSEKS